MFLNMIADFFNVLENDRFGFNILESDTRFGFNIIENYSIFGFNILENSRLDFNILENYRFGFCILKMIADLAYSWK